MTNTPFNLLILIPTRNGISEETRASICKLACFDDVRFSEITHTGISDPAIARQTLAGEAYKQLTSEDEKYTHVLWLDDDIEFDPQTVIQHMRLVNEYPQFSAISGRFVNRYKPNTLAGTRLQTPAHQRADMPFILAGMGCLMLSADTFIYHVACAPKNKSDGRPLVCSGVIVDGQYYGEDFNYSQTLRAVTGKPVVLAPPDIRYGHIVRHVVYPAAG